MGQLGRFAAAFFLTAAVLLSPALWLVSIGELFPQLAWRWGARPALYGPVFDDRAEYKRREWIARRPQVVVLGTSRAEQIRDYVFSRCASGERASDRPCFYNASGAIPSLAIGYEVLRSLTAAAWPDVLLLQVELWHVSPVYEPDLTPVQRMVRGMSAGERADFEFSRAFGSLKVAILNPEWRRAFRQPLTAADLSGWTPYGIVARSAGSGFRPDGSYRHGLSHPALRSAPGTVDGRERIGEILDQVTRRCCTYQPFTMPDPERIEYLRSILTMARSHGTRVVGFTSPLHPQVVDVLERDPVLRTGWESGRQAIGDTFRVAGFPYVDLPSLPDAGCKTNEHWDGYHPTEPCMARVMASLVRRDTEVAAALSAFLDAAEIEALLQQSPSPFVLLPAQY